MIEKRRRHWSHAHVLDVDRYPRRSEACGHACCCPNEACRRRRRSDANDDALLRRPSRLDLVLLAVSEHVQIDTVGRAAERELPKRQKVSLAEEVVHRARGLLGKVHLPLAKPCLLYT